MTSMPFDFSWEVNCVPLGGDELEYYQNLKEENLFGDYFNIEVRVEHQLCFTPSNPPQQPPLIVPFDSFSYQRSLFLFSQDFLEDGSSYIQRHFPDPIIPPELIQSMMPDVIAYAKDEVENPCSVFRTKSGNFNLFNLVLDIRIQKTSDELDDDIINMVMEESMRETQMVPASKIAIESLQKVKLQEGVTKERCSICLVEFDDCIEVSSMPCKHVYHHECLVQWLKTSHVCPLCRYPMPTSVSVID
ncbi:Zinc finger, RING-type [Sesbania bispinosa]|nr:Zinc finger, RING-type [Sesbania bispinosa]